jgi:protein-disulfide isomerase
MIKEILAAFIVTIFVIATVQPWPSLAAEPPRFSDEERIEFEKIIREYLLQHPETITEAIGELQRRQKIAADANAKRAISANQKRLLDDGISVVIGNPDGDVTLIEFYDYQCPFCRRMYKDVLRLAKEDKNLRIVMKQLPIKDAPGDFPASLMAAMMAMAADRQGQFETFHANVFDAAGQGKLSRERLFEIAASSGLNVRRLQADMESKIIMDSIRNNLGLAREIGVTGTPAYVVGEKVIAGAQGYEVLKLAIDEKRESLQSTTTE